MYDTAGEHAAGLTAAIVTLVFVWLALRLFRFLARRRVDWAERWVATIDASPALTRIVALLMLVSGALHLALVPGHEWITGFLFIIDGVGFIGLAIAAFLTTWWRRAAALWLSATIVAYIVWVIAGWETPDEVGIACKLVELIALGLVMRLAVPKRHSWPRRIWRALAYPMMVCVTTLGIWIGGLAHPDAQHAHAGAVLQPVAEVATPAEREAAARLLAETRLSIGRYQDPAAARAAGFEAGPQSDAEPLLHFENKANANVILDPNRPQALVYARTTHGLQLVGAMFQMPRVGQWGPDPGGPLTQWHQHEGICFSPFGIEFSFATPFWVCPIGSTNLTTPPMLHVWIIDNGKNGPFSADLDTTVQHQLQQE
ncbi:MAG TPA: hypothetical protein VM674_08575 [Candidatus Acidoferrum sp.]|nr:hypothetical protein [Candidatus Acidoferrum sp.]